METYHNNPEIDKRIKNNLMIAQVLGWKKSTYDHGINGIKEIWINPDTESEDDYKTPYEFDYHYNYNSLIKVLMYLKNDYKEFDYSIKSKDNNILVNLNFNDYKVKSEGENLINVLYSSIVELVNDLFKF